MSVSRSFGSLWRTLIGTVFALLCDGAFAQISPPAGTSAHPASCADVASQPQRVVVSDDATGVHILQASGSPLTLALRSHLLPKVHYVPGACQAVLISKDGWVLLLDLVAPRLVAEVRVGVSSHDAALSLPNSKMPLVIAVANSEPHSLVFLNEKLQLLKVLQGSDKNAKKSSALAAIRTDPTRNSFIATLVDVPELWELSYDPLAPEIPMGMIHDFQYREGQFVPGYLNPQRSELPSLALDFFMPPAANEVLTAHEDADFSRANASARIQVLHLDTRKSIAVFALPGWPALDRALAWSAGGKNRIAIPNTRLGLLSIVDPSQWKVLGHIRTDGLVRAVQNAPHVPWLVLEIVGATGGLATSMRVDKVTLEVMDD